MNKIRKISRLIIACSTAIASICILAVIVYFYADYEINVVLDTNIDDYTIGFMFLMLFLFSGISFLLFKNYFKKDENIQK